MGANALLGVLAIVLGTVTLRTGWVLPTARRHVTRPRLHGVGVLLIGASLLLQSLLHFEVLPGVSWEARFYSGNALLLGGMLLLGLGYVLPLRRSERHARPSGP
ncbi:solute carrier organic anion transporter [Streptomyces sp. S6]|nr:solute carrier organic anion transporter [Streptomyces sp. S6]